MCVSRSKSTLSSPLPRGNTCLKVRTGPHATDPRCVFRTNVTGHFGNVPEWTGKQDRRCAFPELRPHPVAATLPFQQEGTAPRPAADKDEAQKGERLRTAKSAARWPAPA